LPAWITSPSETTEKLAGCWILPTQQIKGDRSRWGLCSLAISKMSSLALFIKNNIHEQKVKKTTFKEITFMKQMTRLIITSLDIALIL
jgi:hypothetical protein